MKKFVQTLKNIWSIEELRKKILFTLLLIFIYRIGSFIILPGIDPNKLTTPDSAKSGILGLLDAFVGGAFSKASIFALGIMPYISASIFMQLVTILVPSMQKIQKEGESGRKKINQWTRYLTVIVTAFQAAAYIGYLHTQNKDALIESYSYLFPVSTVIILTVGTLFVMWLGERITEKGIGNGTSLIIMTGIIARLPSAFLFEFQSAISGNKLFLFILEMAFLFVVVMATIMVVQGVRRIPIQFAKRMVGRDSSSVPASGDRDYIPVKVNAAGVMPIIFAQALMFLPATAAQFFAGNNSDISTNSVLRALNDYTSMPYNVIYFLLVVIFTYVYTALLVNPSQYSEYLKRQNAFIPGVKPGESTSEYIDAVTTRITLPGSIFLGLIAIMPSFASAFGINSAFAMFFGGTSLLIFVGVVLDTLQQIESYLLMSKYDGLVKSGRVEGRSGGLRDLTAGA